MKIKRYYNQNGIREALTNLTGYRRSTVVDLKDAVADAKTEAELVANLARLDILARFALDRSTVEVVDGRRVVREVRLVTTDGFGNRHYLECVNA